jgi:ABC-type multidrug transport system fused ATPase/permease subunit
MKTCPSCQQVYPDDATDFCTNDGTPLVSSASAYDSGSSGYAWQTPSEQSSQKPPSNWQPPPPNWGHQQPGQYNPPGQYAPYGYQMPYPQSTGGEGLATAALFTGVGTMAALVLGIIIMVIASGSFNRGMYQVGALLVFLSLISGITALILGIVAISMANRNPAISKAKGIIGLCLGIIPLLLMIIGLIVRASQ